MPISQPGVIITQGLGGEAHFSVTQGYLEHEVTLSVSPTAGTVLIDADVFFTADIPVDWWATGGTFSDETDTTATWTAPGTPGKYYITVTDQDNPGNFVIVLIVVLASFAPGIVTASGGSLVDSRIPGAYQGFGGGGPAPPSPVLLPGLVEYQSCIGSDVVGQHSGIDLTAIRGSTTAFQDDAVLAGGRRLHFPAPEFFPDDNAWESPTNALLHDWGSAESFLVIAFVRIDSGETNPRTGLFCGENDASGWDFNLAYPTIGTKSYFFEIPASDNNYPGDAIPYSTEGAWIALRLKWNLATKTLSGAINNGAYTEVAVPQGCGPPDATNVLGLGAEYSSFGIMAIWKGANLPAEEDIEWFINLTGGQAVGRTYAQLSAYTGS